jgi:hypothetical protein
MGIKKNFEVRTPSAIKFTDGKQAQGSSSKTVREIA